MAIPIPKLTVEDYLAIERGAEFKSEFYQGEMFAMAGGTARHSSLAASMTGILWNRLAARGCIVFTSDMRVQTAPGGLYTYPDVTVLCEQPVFANFANKVEDVLLNPKVIVDVLSDSTEAKDRGFKFQQYKKIASLEEYVLVSQSEPLVERYGRRPDTVWTEYSEARGLEATLELKSLGIEIPLAEIYTNITFEAS